MTLFVDSFVCDRFDVCGVGLGTRLVRLWVAKTTTTSSYTRGVSVICLCTFVIIRWAEIQANLAISNNRGARWRVTVYLFS